jgi:hypothetical protein
MTGDLRIRLNDADLEHLDAFAVSLGISREDAAGRKLRYALRVGPFVNENPGQAFGFVALGVGLFAAGLGVIMVVMAP